MKHGPRVPGLNRPGFRGDSVLAIATVPQRIAVGSSDTSRPTATVGPPVVSMSPRRDGDLGAVVVMRKVLQVTG